MNQSRLRQASDNVILISFTSAILTLTTGCAQLNASIPPLELVADMATEAAKEPATWLPLAAAALIGVSDSDNDISDWASDNTPLFGSQRRAGYFSDDLRNTLVAGAALSSLLARDPNENEGFPTRRVVTNVLAFGTVAGLVETGKQTVGRERPNERDNRSFPSGHSSASFTSAILIEQNFNATIKKPWLRRAIKVGTYSSAAAVAWARVEAKEHHPVDVLASAALSNFVVKTFYKSIGFTSTSANPSVTFETDSENFAVQLNINF